MGLARRTSKLDFVLCSCKHQAHTRIKQYNKYWKQLNCKVKQAFSNAAKMSQFESVMQKILYVEVLPTPNSMEEGGCSPPSPHSGCTPPHSSMRHRRFFDIIESMCRPNTGLQLGPSMRQFRCWVQKLFNCKNWKAVWTTGSRQPRRPSYLIYWTPTHQKIFWKIFFLKKSSDVPCQDIKTSRIEICVKMLIKFVLWRYVVSTLKFFKTFNLFFIKKINIDYS